MEAADTIGLRQPGQDLVREADVLGVVLGGHPEPEHLGPVLREQFLGRHVVALRLGHLAALAVHHEAMGEDGAVGRLVAGADGLQEGGVEPAPVLVRALEIHVGRPVQIGPRLEHGRVAAAGVEPHIQNVRFLTKLGAAAAAA